MTEERVKRKLRGILSADVVGYSRLLRENEPSTIRNLEENKKLIFKRVEEFEGSVVDASADNILAEFSSVMNAVQCALKIQQELSKKNSKLLENQRVEFRIGINLGDVVVEDGRVYGSGVSIAARLEDLAEPTGIFVSRQAYDHVKGKLELGYEYLGEHSVKDTSEPVRIYRVLTDPESAGKVIGEKRPSRSSIRMAVAGIIILCIAVAGLIGWNTYFQQSKKMEPASLDRMAYRLPDKPSIAVLPFENLNGDPDQEYFVLGLSEEILNFLCQISSLDVAGKTSSFYFKGKNKKVQEIVNELGVEYILEGSVRKAGNALRITAQLLRGTDGFHLWSKTYYKEFKVEEMFSVQEDIAARVADELELTLGIDRSFKMLGGTDNFEAYELYLIAKGQYTDWVVKGQFINWEKNRAIESVNAAIELDQEFALAWAFKALVHLVLTQITSIDLVSLEFNASLKAARRAIALEPSLGESYFSLGAVHLYRGEFVKAELSYRKGMELTSELIDIEYGLALHYGTVGYLRKCKELLEKMRRKDPLQPLIRAAYLLIVGCLGDMEKAEKEYERGKEIFGDSWNHGDFYIMLLRFGTKDNLSLNDIPASGRSIPYYTMMLNSPEEFLVRLRRSYGNDDNLSSSSLYAMAVAAAFLDEREFALYALERSASLNSSFLYCIWAPAMKEVRQLPRFKEFVREIGLVDYWNQFGWPDLCRPVGDDDFECD